VSQSSSSIVTSYYYEIFLVAYLNLPSCDVPESNIPPGEILRHCGLYQACWVARSQVSVLVALLQNRRLAQGISTAVTVRISCLHMSACVGKALPCLHGAASLRPSTFMALQQKLHSSQQQA